MRYGSNLHVQLQLLVGTRDKVIIYVDSRDAGGVRFGAIRIYSLATQIGAIQECVMPRTNSHRFSYKRSWTIGLALSLLVAIAFGAGMSGHATAAPGANGQSAYAPWLAPPAASIDTLHDFAGAPKDGSTPYSPVIRDSAGNLYGTTYWGGANDNGAIYKLVPSSKVTTLLYSFKGGKDGAGPHSGLIQDAAGNFYGTTVGGGDTGVGTLFQLNATGKEKVVASFKVDTSGAYPYGGLIIDAAGNIYGTASYGGKGTCTLNGNKGCGTVFELSPSNGAFAGKMLHNFTGQTVGGDGAVPMGALLLDPQGNLYGTTYLGGRHNKGAVFKIDASGKETVIHNFGEGPDGILPAAGLIRDAADNLYGTTYYGGLHTMGSIFKIDTTGKESVLYSFGAGSDGQNPAASLLADAKGNLYGTTQYGGYLNCSILPGFGCGIVFKVDASGAETILHDFKAQGDGAFPTAALIPDGAGNALGTTTVDDKDSIMTFGTVFKIAVSQ
jgi:uncharacterized repeat protein (TIGR03803 family)